MKKLKIPLILLILLLSNLCWASSGWIMKPQLGRKINTSHQLGPAGGLVSLWLFNEGSGGQVFDLSGNGNHGTLDSNTNFAPAKFGSGINSGLNSSGHILVADDSTLVGMSQLTLAIWAKNNKTSISATGTETLFRKRDGGPDSYEFYWAQSEDIGFMTDTGSGNVYAIQTDYLTDNNWHLWVARYDGAEMSVWKDGIKGPTTAAQTGTIHSGGDNLLIGGDGTSSSWDGLIDCVMIYSRALSASEIALLYREPFCMIEPSWNYMLYGAISVPIVGGQVIIVNTN